MKSLKFKLSLIIFTAILSQSCRKGSMWGIEGKGSSETQSRYVDKFNAIDLSIDADIEYIQDSTYQVTVSGQNNILAVLETKVEGGELQLNFRRNVWNHGALHFVIHSPEMVSMKISGSGDITVKNYLKGNNVALKISGSGNMYIPYVNIQNLDAKISGSGKVYVNSGTCTNQDLTISGSGTLDTKDVAGLTGIVKLSGSGDIAINAANTLNVSISGSGSVKYRGKPALTTSISGSGTLTHIE